MGHLARGPFRQLREEYVRDVSHKYKSEMAQLRRDVDLHDDAVERRREALQNARKAVDRCQRTESTDDYERDLDEAKDELRRAEGAEEHARGLRNGINGLLNTLKAGVPKDDRDRATVDGHAGRFDDKPDSNTEIDDVWDQINDLKPPSER